jgi:hypothetical protein
VNAAAKVGKDVDVTPAIFKTRRIVAHHTQASLAPVIHKSRRSISMYETGRAPIPPLVADAMRRLEKRENGK